MAVAVAALVLADELLETRPHYHLLPTVKIQKMPPQKKMGRHNQAPRVSLHFDPEPDETDPVKDGVDPSNSESDVEDPPSEVTDSAWAGLDGVDPQLWPRKVQGWSQPWRQPRQEPKCGRTRPTTLYRLPNSVWASIR